MKTINFKYDDVAYTLCFTKRTVQQLEASGFNIQNIDGKAHYCKQKKAPVTGKPHIILQRQIYRHYGKYNGCRDFKPYIV